MLSALQPGIMNVYEDILCPGGAQLLTQAVPQSLVGSTYKQARRSFDDVLACGYIRDGRVQLLPSESKSEVLRATDRLVVLSHGPGSDKGVDANAVATFEGADAMFRALYNEHRQQHKAAPAKVVVLAMVRRGTIIFFYITLFINLHNVARLLF